jgi:hypothetical protein
MLRVILWNPWFSLTFTNTALWPRGRLVYIWTLWVYVRYSPNVDQTHNLPLMRKALSDWIAGIFLSVVTIRFLFHSNIILLWYFGCVLFKEDSHIFKWLFQAVHPPGENTGIIVITSVKEDSIGQTQRYNIVFCCVCSTSSIYRQNLVLSRLINFRLWKLFFILKLKQYTMYSLFSKLFNLVWV